MADDINGKEFSRPEDGRYLRRYIQFATSLLLEYKGAEPFHLYLKKYFSLNKKHGSKDRKNITSLSYNFLRLGIPVSRQSLTEEMFLLGTFLNESLPSVLLAKLKPEWNEKIHWNLNDKLKTVKDRFNVQTIFPFLTELSNQIDPGKFAFSFLQQPKLFIRIRPREEEIVMDKVNSANFTFERINEYCIAFSHNEKITSILNIDKEAVIQDYSSQRVFNFFKSENSTFLYKNWLKKNDQILTWDCCAGSGGKSILAIDILKNLRLTVTDKRESILQNLHQRFALAGIKDYDAFVMDLTSRIPGDFATLFQFIVADVPCSGSGTWSRTPEQLSFFNEKEIKKYVLLQKQIIENTIPHLTNDGILVYITCSVFKKENEENVEYFLEKLPLKLLHMEYLKGYEMQADTLFAAVLKKI